MQMAGYHAGRLRRIGPILKEWVNLNREACETWEGDVPWRYQELASVGIFAGAVWRKGGFVIQEYARHKLRREAKESAYFGRGDIWFEFSGTEFDCEAKLCYHKIAPRADPRKLIASTLLRAVNDAVRLKKYKQPRTACGLVISVPLLPIRSASWKLVTDRTALRERLENWIAALRSQDTACAWYVRPDLYGPSFSDGLRPECLFPGVGLVIKGAGSSEM